jgi:uncharacterized membrane protein
MMKGKTFRYALGLILLGGILTVFTGQVALAAPAVSDNPSGLPPSQEQPVTEEKITAVTSFPVVKGQSGTSFEYDFELSYEGLEARVFEFKVIPPEGWTAAVKRKFRTDETTVLAVRIEPGNESPERFTVKLDPLPDSLPEPGEYPLIVEVSSGSLKDRLELTAIVSDKPSNYELDLVTSTGKLDARVNAGEDNHLILILTNTGEDVVESIAFSGVKSDGWDVTFEPPKLESLTPGQSEQVVVTIRPPRETIAGDYNVLLRGIGDTASDQLSMRIKVTTPTFWGWVSGGITAAIIVSIVLVFRRLGRR